MSVINQRIMVASTLPGITSIIIVYSYINPSTAKFTVECSKYIGDFFFNDPGNNQGINEHCGQFWLPRNQPVNHK